MGRSEHLQASASMARRSLVLLAASCMFCCTGPTPSPGVGVGVADGFGDSTATTGDGCAGTLRLCGGACVDTAINVAHCGTCDKVCGPGEVCNQGYCGLLPTDCAQAGGCPGGFYCEPTDKTCKPGCLLPTDCPTPGSCDAKTHICACAEDTHACGATCVANDSAASCGASCEACPAVPNANATCDTGACGFACSDGFVLCEGKCVTQQQCDDICKPCSPPANSVAFCKGTECDFTCNMGFHRCGDVCASDTSVQSCGTSCSPCPLGSNVTSAACTGGFCKAATCASGHHLCGSQCLSNTSTNSCGNSCTPCIEPGSHGKAVCAGGNTCGVQCDKDYTHCGNACSKCPESKFITATGCVGDACLATGCVSGYAACGGDCTPCPEGTTNAACASGKCVAKACSAGFQHCGGDCCGLEQQTLSKQSDDGPVGVDHLPDGRPIAAWDNTYYGKNLYMAVVDKDGNAGKPSKVGGKDAKGLSLAVAKTTWHLSYIHNPFNKQVVLRHAWRQESTSWTNEDITLETYNLWRTNLDVGPDGKLHLVVSDGGKKKLHYFEKAGAKWSVSVFLPVWSGYEFSLAVDTKGVAHVLAADYNGVKYSHGKGGSHSAGPVVTTDKWANHPSVAVDEKGTVYAIWATKHEVWTSKLMGAAWAAPAKVADSFKSSPTAIAVDSKGAMRVVFGGCNLGQCSARYGVQVGGGWSLQTLGNKSTVKHLALSLNGKDEPAIVVGTQSDGVFFFAP